MDEIPENVQKFFYFPICSDEETERILAPKDAADKLLILQANTIIDHMRLFRVIRNLKLENEHGWSLTKYLSNPVYTNTLGSLNKDHYEKCKDITKGNLYSNDPNGSIEYSDFGPLLTISKSIEPFIEYMNLYLLDFSNELPQSVRNNALRISLRIMMQKETLDFHMDPRGIIPGNIKNSIMSTIPFQYHFIAGHEYAHYILDHLKGNDNYSSQPKYRAIFSRDEDCVFHEQYNFNQKQEFEADLFSLTKIEYPKKMRNEIILSTLLWFNYLEIYEHALDVIKPRNPYSYRSHPSASDRYLQILDVAKAFKVKDLDPYILLKKRIDTIKDLIEEDLSLNIEDYEVYGSVYLAAPNSKWRGPVLRDRIDYY